LAEEGKSEDLRIRVHRACCALEQAEACEGLGQEASNVDSALIFRWIALNSLYGHWDTERGMPVPDRRALDTFTSQVARVDEGGRMSAALNALRAEAAALLENPFLIERFWASAEWETVRPQRGRMRKFEAELRENRPGAALHRLLMAVYFLRCQMVHGGATIGSSMNRVTVEPAAAVLRLMTGQVIALVMEQGDRMEWGELCYPPIRE
jgi:hypothetical protein